MYSFLLTEKKIEIDTDSIQFTTIPELLRWAKKIKIYPKDTKNKPLDLNPNEYAVPLIHKSKEKKINPKTGRLKNIKTTKYLITNIKPKDRTLKNLPYYANNTPKVRFQDWLLLKKVPKLYDKLDNVSWGWSPNGKCYGWSHRAVSGFKVGQKVSKDTCGNPRPNESWEIKTEEEAEKMAKLFAQDVS